MAPMLGKIQRLHFVGIGGIGMSGIAELLLNQGYEISGSDIKESTNTRRLERLGARVHVGHDAGHVEEAQVVVTSSAVADDNPEVEAARQRGVPVIPRGEMLAELMRMKQGVAVAGSHGKTTTTSMIAKVVETAGLDATIVIGGVLKEWGSNARLGQGDLLIAEADESDGSFLRLTPTISVVTNIDVEHLDHYADFEELREAFRQFLDKVPFYGAGVVCVDDAEVRSLVGQLSRRVVTYGTSEDAEFRAADVRVEPWGTAFTCLRGGQELGPVRLRLLGRHNALNALATVAVASELEIDFEDVATGLAEFGGADRRFQVVASVDDVLVVDDYGHHPTEIAAVLSAAREAWRRRILVVFQPHRYSRSKLLRDEFGRVFRDADTVFVLPIYPAGEEPLPGVTGEDLAAAMVEHGHDDVRSVADLEEARRALHDEMRPGDLVLTLGAGDVYRIAHRLADDLQAAAGSPERGRRDRSDTAAAADTPHREEEEP